MVDRKLENNSPEKNLESMDDRSKTQEELIAELRQLRNEVASLKRSSPLVRKVIPSSAETISEIGLTEFSQSYTVLLVEDDELTRTGFRRYLTDKPHKNCQVVEFSNAEDALVWCRDHTPDIALIDYLLPGINGIAFVTVLGQQGNRDPIPCIMMTSYQDEALLIEAIKSGVKDFLDKTRITPEGLNRAIANVLQRSFLLRQQEFQQNRQNLVNAIAYHSIENSSELEQVFQYTVDEIRRLLQCDRVFIYQLLPDDKGEIITESIINETFSLLGKKIQDNYFTENPEWKNWYFQGKMKSVSDVLTDAPNSENYQQFFKQIQIRSFLTIPIFQDKNLWGLITANQCLAPREWTTTEIELLNQIALQIGLAIQTVSLNQKAEKERQERQKIEEKLRTSEADLLEAQRIAHLGHWKWNKATNKVWWSEEIHHIYGISPTQEITFPFIIETIHPDDKENVLRQIAEALQGKDYNNVFRIYRPDGMIRFIQTTGKVTFDGQGNLTGMKGINLDITDLKKVETELNALNITLEERVKERTQELTSVYLRLQNELEEREQIELEKQKSEEFYSEYLEMELIERQRIERALSESEIRYRRIVETASEGIWQLDEENKTVFVNPKMAEILGYSVEEMMEKSILDFLLKTDKTALDYLLKQREYSLIHSYDIQFCRRDGSILWAMVSSRPIFDGSGQYLGCLKMVTDISDRKQAEAELQEREAFLRAIGDNIPKGVLYQLSRELDGSYRFIYLSAGIEAESGYKAEEIYQNSNLLFSSIVEEDCLLVLQKYQESFENLAIFDLSVRVRSPQGEIRWVRLCASPRRLEDDRTIWDGIRLDIDDLKQSEEKFRQIAETIQDVFYVYSRNFKQLIYISPSYERIWQLSCESLAQDSLSFLTRIHPDDRDWVMARMESSLEDHLDFRLEYRLLLPDGSIRWIDDRVFFIRNEAGEAHRIVGLASDISDHKQSEAILKEFNRRWRSVLDNIQMIVVQLDQQGVVQYINPFFLKTYQFDLEEIMGENWLDKFIPARLRPAVDKVFEEVLYHELHRYYENPIIIKSNEERIIAWRTCSLKDNRGEACGIIAIGEDVTERHYLEKMKSEFVSIVSHELKTPLTTIQASLSLLDGKFIDPSSKEGEETISIATEGVDRLARLVDDILDLERLRLGKLTMLKTICNTQKIIESAIAQIQELAKQTNTKIEVFGESFSCYADSDRLVQVLTNLIINAIKFSPHQSTIELSVKQKDPDSSHEIDAKPYLLFAVRDRGRGIPAKNLESIFERFQQIDASDSREKGGTGLGLSICQDIVEQHDGKIWAESLLEEGSTFFFTIPIQSTEIMSNDI